MHDKQGCNLLIPTREEAGAIPTPPEQPHKAKPGLPELSTASLLHEHLCRVAAWMARQHREFHPIIRDESHRVLWETASHRWTTLSADELGAMVWEYTQTAAAHLLSEERQSYRSSHVHVDDAFRSAYRAAQLAVETWDTNAMDKAVSKGRVAQAKAAPRGKVITDEMVLPYLDSLQGLNYKQAAERLASWDWPTKKGRHSAATFNRVLHRLGFVPEGEQRRRQPTVREQELDHMDGMTQQQKAEALGTSVRTVQRASNRGANKSRTPVAPLSVTPVAGYSTTLSTHSSTEPHINNVGTHSAGTLSEPWTIEEDPAYWAALLMRV